MDRYLTIRFVSHALQHYVGEFFVKIRTESVGPVCVNQGIDFSTVVLVTITLGGTHLEFLTGVVLSMLRTVTVFLVINDFMTRKLSTVNF